MKPIGPGSPDRDGIATSTCFASHSSTGNRMSTLGIDDHSDQRRDLGVDPNFTNFIGRMPLTIVAQILPGRRVVVRPTPGAIGSISARYHGADAA